MGKSLDDLYKKIAQEQSALMNSLTYYICTNNKVLQMDLIAMSITSLKLEIKKILKHIRFANIDLETLELQIQKEALMIDCFRNSFYISGENYDSIGAGRNNGMIPNNIEAMHIDNLEKESIMLEEQRKRFAKRDLLKKSLGSNNKLINDTIEIIPNELYRRVVHDFYIGNIATAQLAQKYNIAYDSVGKAHARGIDAIAKILKNYLIVQNVK